MESKGSNERAAAHPPSGSAEQLNPIESTVYVGNINFSLTNNDLIKLFQNCGPIVSARVVKDNFTRMSKGYAFVQFQHSAGALACTNEFNGKFMFGRIWSCRMAKDNGRSREFIMKRTYPDKTHCYECGQAGHLSYVCPKNALGCREVPPKKRKRESNNLRQPERKKCEEPSTSKGMIAIADSESLSEAIRLQHSIAEEAEYRQKVVNGDYSSSTETPTSTRKYVQDEYFSDEEDLYET